MDECVMGYMLHATHRSAISMNGIHINGNIHVFVAVSHPSHEYSHNSYLNSTRLRIITNQTLLK